MVEDIMFSLNKANDLKATDIVEHLRADEKSNDFQSGKIQVNGKYYDIQFVKNDQKIYVDVKRDFKGIFSYFRNRWGNKHTNCANDLKSSIKNILASKEYVLVKNNFDALLAIGRKANMNNIEIGNYGFSDNRNLIIKQSVVDAVNRTLQKEGLTKKLLFNKIDTYNNVIGITTRTLNITNYNNLMSNLTSKNLNAKDKYCKHFNIDKQKANAWINFIQRPENISKINIVKKLYNYMNQDDDITTNDKQTGWKADFKKNPDQALRNFIIKNSSLKMKELTPDFLNQATAIFKEFITISNLPEGNEKQEALTNFFKEERWLSKKDQTSINNVLLRRMNEDDCDIDQALKECYNGDRRNHNKMYHFINNILMYATFRQTSKLGLDFFREQNISVLFQHADRQHTDLNEKNAMEKILSENFWKEGRTDKSESGSEITYSEIRHAKQLQDKYGEESGIFYVTGVKENPMAEDVDTSKNLGAPRPVGTPKDAFVEITPSKYQ
ncbi:MAG: hypothetical protein K6G15_01250 [Desulfovibrio sp.]|nr:hypothetical protein [Desulfovibrio sp.]